MLEHLPKMQASNREVDLVLQMFFGLHLQVARKPGLFPIASLQVPSMQAQKLHPERVSPGGEEKSTDS
jgi:hypothetical protein